MWAGNIGYGVRKWSLPLQHAPRPMCRPQVSPRTYPTRALPGIYNMPTDPLHQARSMPTETVEDRSSGTWARTPREAAAEGDILCPEHRVLACLHSSHSFCFLALHPHPLPFHRYPSGIHPVPGPRWLPPVNGCVKLLWILMTCCSWNPAPMDYVTNLTGDNHTLLPAFLHVGFHQLDIIGKNREQGLQLWKGTRIWSEIQ